MIIFKTAFPIALYQQLYFHAGFAGVELIIFSIADDGVAFWIFTGNRVDNVELLTVQQI